MWASAVVSPFVHIVAFALLAPLPWILVRRFSPFWAFLLGVGLAVVVCELLALLLPRVDGWFLGHVAIAYNRVKLAEIYLSLVGPAMMVVGGLVAARARSDEARDLFQAEALVAKTRLLQSQVHPHVLFNALNGLAELIHKDANAAERAVQHLADLLRRILRASEHTTLPLAEEYRLVADYLALESIRLASRLRVTWEWDEGLNTLEVPPLLLQPLVENAIKHGIAPSISGGELVLRAAARGRDVVFEVWNTGMSLQHRGGSGGIGVANLRSRLQLKYGARATLEIGAQGGGTLAIVHLRRVLD